MEDKGSASERQILAQYNTGEAFMKKDELQTRTVENDRGSYIV